MSHLNPAPLRVLITAGPTHEPIDAVRYLANRSSGRTGLALAATAVGRGHSTTLLLGPTSLAEPPKSSHLSTHRFQTAAELEALLREHWPGHDLLLMVAAVADYRPRRSAPAEKIPRGEGPLTLELEPTPDLLAEMAAITRPDQVLVGFALQAERGKAMVEAARRKLERKRLDAIVVNPLETMGSQEITATLIRRDGSTKTAPKGLIKMEFAEWLMDEVEALPRGVAAGSP